MATDTQTAEPKAPRLLVTPGPHLSTPESVSTVMWTVTATLLPAGAVGVYYFGFRALAVMLVSVIAAVAAEYVGERFVLGRQKPRLQDGSAVLTGLLLAYCLPAAIPLWQAALGSALAVFVAKTVFGGLGNNIFNPALIGRAILLAAYPASMTDWSTPVRHGALVPASLFGVDSVSGATPLAAVKGALAAAARSGEALPLAKISPTWLDVKATILGNVGGCLGETCALALLIGGLWLIYRKIISWHIPVVYIGTVFALSVLFALPRALGAEGGGAFDYLLMTGLFNVFAGGLFLGAFFMATDMVTSPYTGPGKMIFAAGAGFLVVLIRNGGGYPEGVCYSILLMNITVPLIDRYTLPKKFGLKKAA